MQTIPYLPSQVNYDDMDEYMEWCERQEAAHESMMDEWYQAEHGESETVITDPREFLPDDWPAF